MLRLLHGAQAAPAQNVAVPQDRHRIIMHSEEVTIPIPEMSAYSKTIFHEPASCIS